MRAVQDLAVWKLFALSRMTHELPGATGHVQTPPDTDVVSVLVAARIRPVHVHPAAVA